MHRLAGKVEVDETYIGGEEPGLTGRPGTGQEGEVEIREPKGMGCRIAPLADTRVAPVRDGPRRTRRDGHHRRLAAQRNRDAAT